MHERIRVHIQWQIREWWVTYIQDIDASGRCRMSSMIEVFIWPIPWMGPFVIIWYVLFGLSLMYITYTNQDAMLGWEIFERRKWGNWLASYPHGFAIENYRRFVMKLQTQCRQNAPEGKLAGQLPLTVVNVQTYSVDSINLPLRLPFWVSAHKQQEFRLQNAWNDEIRLELTFIPFTDPVLRSSDCSYKLFIHPRKILRL